MFVLFEQYIHTALPVDIKSKQHLHALDVLSAVYLHLHSCLFPIRIVILMRIRTEKYSLHTYILLSTLGTDF
jgi:hypothetical protein